ncbi:hypothetical protein HPP_4150 [Hydrangea phyllody phytoplasma]|uniref:AAA+ ATPase domain-containing protein n=2 Tax=16SrI (Aster yellows group) TaxID=3042590 RepID=A0ABQ5PSI6_9MOLU|nr:AAA family ATPase [Hydrangea phyllody phytoplasma]GFZ75457.1 hypothetical protein HPP_4150 [Hydrangea phyllody phytoplasma]GLH61468.1 hypothetical protein RHYP_4140 [Rhus yellows phytoplasma]GLH61782.1 hypothetical protein HP2P_1890 [Hydrangea phyllody phytoplasma]
MKLKNKSLTLTLIILILVTFFSLVLALVLNYTKNDHENQFVNGPFPDSNFPGKPNEDDDQSQNNSSNVSAMNSDFLSGLLDVLTPPEFNFENFKRYDFIFGLKEPIKKLKEIGDRFDLSKKHKYNLGKEGKPTKLPRGVIFYGPPGTGKTLLAECFAKEHQLNFYIITPANTLEEIENIFAKARKNSPSIVFADEAEETIKARDSKDFLEPGDAKKTALILAELDGVKTDPDKPICFVAATNHLGKIDSAIVSRLEPVYIGNIEPNERIKFLRLMAKLYKINQKTYDYLRVIADNFNYCLDHPEMFAEAIEHGYVIPSVAKKSVRGRTKIGDKEYLYGNLDPVNNVVDRNERLEKMKKAGTQYNPPTDQNGKPKYDIEVLEGIKKHFFDLLSGRKLENLITNAANKAGFYGHSEILISDLEEAFGEYFGHRQDYLNNNNLSQEAKEALKKINNSLYNETRNNHLGTRGPLIDEDVQKKQ